MRYHSIVMRQDYLKKRAGNAQPEDATSVASGERESWLMVAVVVVVLALATAGAYYRVATSEFVDYDDRDYVTVNPQVQKGLTWEGVKWAFTSFHASNWHPLTWMSHMLDVSLFGMRAGGHHLTSLAFHTLSTLLLLAFLKRATGKLWASAFVAALFALHPLHVESVAWIAERKDVLSTFFWFGALWMYVCYAQRPNWPAYAAVIALFGLGLLSKPMLVTLPVILLFLDYWPLERFSGGHRQMSKLVLEKVPMALMAAGSALVTLAVQRGAMPTYESMNLSSRITNAIVSYWRYIRDMLWPRGLAAMYTHSYKPLYAYAALVLALLVAVTVVVLFMRTRYRYLFTGWFWYLITLLPVIGFVQVGAQSHADRYTYIPLTGLFIMVAWGGQQIIQRWRSLKMPLVAAGVAMLCAFGFVASRTVDCWRDNGALFSSWVKANRDDYRMISNLGLYFVHIGEVDRGMAELQKSLAIMPGDPYTLNGIGTVMFHRGQYDEAVRYYGAAIKASPKHEQANMNMGLALAALGRDGEAVSYLNEAVTIKPDWAQAYAYLGQALGNLGRFDEGREALEKAIRLDPRMVDGYFGLSGIYARKGDLAAAVVELKKARDISPDYRILSTLGVCLMQLGEHKAAEESLRQAILIEPDNPEAHVELAAALNALGRRDEAIAEFGKAVELDPGNEQLKAQYRTLTGAGQ